MYKYLILIIINISIISFSFSQSNYESPYSRFGIGDLMNKSFGQSKALGKSAIGLRDNEHINFNNPASYSSLDSLNFVLEVGILNNFIKYETSDNSAYGNSTNLNYLALGFPVTKWWFSSIGLMPYSTVGYNISTSDSIQHLGKVDYKYKGVGGINQFTIGNSFKITKNFSLGANVSYLFGSLVYTKKADFIDDLLAFDYYYYDSTNVSDINYELGAQYTYNINENKDITFGLVFNNSKNINVNKTSFARVTGNGSSAIIKNTEDEQGVYKFPFNAGFGFSYTNNNKLVIVADYIQQNWSQANFFGQNDTLKDSRYIALGCEYIPNKESINNYLKRIKYRFGGYYSNSYLNLNNQQLNDFGITFGFGLPLRKTKTSLNLSFEIGQRGTTNNNLIKETYAVVGLNLTLHDLWFLKRKFD